MNTFFHDKEKQKILNAITFRNVFYLQSGTEECNGTDCVVERNLEMLMKL